ncbi:MAG: DUF2917 domain-containing protein [Burkholderiaceae bacterium]|jgi:hypothetical protein|nr:DUF2917 domain-containing protein [Burkholderiaceae bacterium]
MIAIHVPDSQQSTGITARHGFFDLNTLRAGHAVSLKSRKSMQLRLLSCSGNAWVTCAPAGGGGDAAGAQDLILAAGESLTVRPGQHLVMEPFAEQSVRYQWSATEAG